MLTSKLAGLLAFSSAGLSCVIEHADEVISLQKYNHLFDRNEKDGTFYLQSKVYRARERLEQEWGVNLEEATGQKPQQAAAEAQHQSKSSQHQE